eukprot:7725-Eustigmatos_ZCMA.PRE.1
MCEDPKRRGHASMVHTTFVLPSPVDTTSPVVVVDEAQDSLVRAEATSGEGAVVTFIASAKDI